MTPIDTNATSLTGGIKTIVRAENLAILVLTLFAYSHLHLNWWLFAALLFVPDISLAAYLANPRFGAQCYNLVHSYIAPLILLGAAAAYPRFLPFALIWLTHVSMDRALGYGLKYTTAFTDTHLGKIGRPTAS